MLVAYVRFNIQYVNGKLLICSQSTPDGFDSLLITNFYGKYVFVRTGNNFRQLTSSETVDEYLCYLLRTILCSQYRPQRRNRCKVLS